MAPARIYIEKVSKVVGDTNTGIAKITWSGDAGSDSPDSDVLEMVISVNNLREAFDAIGEKMQSLFGEGGQGGGRGGRGPGAGGPGGGQRRGPPPGQGGGHGGPPQGQGQGRGPGGGGGSRFQNLDE